METTENFIPRPEGKIFKRPGYKHVKWSRKTFWVRLMMWWNGDPTEIHQLLEFNGQLFAATNRGLYIMQGDVLRPVPYVVEC